MTDTESKHLRVGDLVVDNARIGLVGQVDPVGIVLGHGKRKVDFWILWSGVSEGIEEVWCKYLDVI